MLMAAGIEVPKVVFSHGWWTFNKEKISKSRGKIINVDDLIAIAGVDSARYFLFREASFGEDGDFSSEILIERHNTELANKLGNLVARVSGLIEKNGLEKTENTLWEHLDVDKIITHFDRFELDRALSEIFSFIDKCNEYVQNKKPWETKDKKVLYELADSIKAIAVLLWPYIPSTSEKIAEQFGFSVGENSVKELETPLNVDHEIKKGEILFRKIEN